MCTINSFSKVSALFSARLHIGYVAFPYSVLGFFLHWSLFGFDLEVFTTDEGSFFRFLMAILIAFIYMPYLFVINDFFDAPYDALDEKKRNRNPFCNESFRKNPYVRISIGIPVIIILILGFSISEITGYTTILALFLGTFYSAPPLRFKETPIADFIVHGFCLGLYFFSLGFYAIYLTPNPYILIIFWLGVYLAFIDAAWIHLDSALVDYYTDKKGDQKTTVVTIGPQKSIIILFFMLLSILALPSIFYLTEPNFNTKFGPIGLILGLVFLLLPISYILLTYLNRSHFEKVRTISSRFRVYIVYSLVISVVILTNVSLY